MNISLTAQPSKKRKAAENSLSIKKIKMNDGSSAPSDSTGGSTNDDVNTGDDGDVNTDDNSV